MKRVATTTYLVIILMAFLVHLGLSWTAPSASFPLSASNINNGYLSVSRLRQQLLTRGLRTTLRSAIALPSRLLDPAHLQHLTEQKFVVIPNFLSEEQLDGLRADVDKVRSRGKFAVAKIGQDSTNMLNTNIRVAETCFLGPSKLLDVPNPVREQLYDILDGVRRELVSHASTSSTTTATTAVELDSSLTELLYAYYPKGGFYRRHRDAVPGSASTLRKYSLLLYLNQDWDVRTDGGCLRLHFDSGGDELPPGEEPSFLDVSPVGGTLVLFQSDAIPHEVLDTLDRDRLAVVGWYNRPVRISDAVELSSGSGGAPLRLIMLAVALALVTGGVVSLVS